MSKAAELLRIAESFKNNRSIRQHKPSIRRIIESYESQAISTEVWTLEKIFKFISANVDYIKQLGLGKEFSCISCAHHDYMLDDDIDFDTVKIAWLKIKTAMGM